MSGPANHDGTAWISPQEELDFGQEAAKKVPESDFGWEVAVCGATSSRSDEDNTSTVGCSPLRGPDADHSPQN